jgi:hypothetical protein
MTIPVITEFNTYQGVKLGNNEWDANLNQIISYLTAGTYDPTFGIVHATTFVGDISGCTGFPTFDVSVVAGENITAKNAVRVDTATGLLYNCTNTTAAGVTNFLGIASASVLTGQSCLVKTNRFDTFTGLSAGSIYYLGASGLLTTVKPATYPKAIGYALSSTSLIISPDSEQNVSFSNLNSIDATITNLLAPTSAVLSSHFQFSGTTMTALTNFDTTFTAYTGKAIIIEGVSFDGGILTATQLSGTLLTAAQTNITSLGTLTSLAISGNITSGGSFDTSSAGGSNGGIIALTAQNTSGGYKYAMLVSGPDHPIIPNAIGFYSYNRSAYVAWFSNSGDFNATGNIKSIFTNTSAGGLSVQNLSNGNGAYATIALASDTCQYQVQAFSSTYTGNSNVLRHYMASTSTVFDQIGNTPIYFKTNAVSRLTILGDGTISIPGITTIGEISINSAAISTAVNNLVISSPTDTYVLINGVGFKSTSIWNLTNLYSISESFVFRTLDQTQIAVISHSTPAGSTKLSLVGLNASDKVGFNLSTKDSGGSAVTADLYYDPALGLYSNQDLYLPNGSNKVFIGGNQIITSRRTGWTALTGTSTRSSFDTATITLVQLAQVVKALQEDITTHGLIGA